MFRGIQPLPLPGSMRNSRRIARELLHRVTSTHREIVVGKHAIHARDRALPIRRAGLACRPHARRGRPRRRMSSQNRIVTGHSETGQQELDASRSSQVDEPAAYRGHRHPIPVPHGCGTASAHPVLSSAALPQPTLRSRREPARGIFTPDRAGNDCDPTQAKRFLAARAARAVHGRC